MNPRDIIRSAAYAFISGNIEPLAAYDDIRSPGIVAEVSSPVFAKYGVDISQNTIYDLLKANMPRYCDIPLFSECTVDSGYLNLVVSTPAYCCFVEQLNRLLPDIGSPSCCIRIGFGYAEFVHAQLVNIASSAATKGFVMPTSEKVRRALWLCLIAGYSRYSLTEATKAAAAAVQHYLYNDRSSISSDVASAMAAVIFNRILSKQCCCCTELVYK